jgi:hypothetical protein
MRAPPASGVTALRHDAEHKEADMLKEPMIEPTVPSQQSASEKLHFEFTELEARLAPTTTRGCGSCKGCDGCGSGLEM